LENLWIARKRAKLTQKQLGKRVGASNIMISRFETGVTIPKADVLKRIATELGVTTDYLMEQSS
jgi:transcriptional regulator with XRE-family HTH domain